MTKAQRMLMELFAHLEKDRARLGAVNPQHSYHKRLVYMAERDAIFLDDLYRSVTRDGGFHQC